MVTSTAIPQGQTAPRATQRRKPKAHARKAAHQPVPQTINQLPYGSPEGDNSALDRLTAAYLRSHPNATLQTVDLYSFINWSIARAGSNRQTLQPGEPMRTMTAGAGA